MVVNHRELQHLLANAGVADTTSVKKKLVYEKRFIMEKNLTCPLLGLHNILLSGAITMIKTEAKLSLLKREKKNCVLPTCDSLNLSTFFKKEKIQEHFKIL